MSRTAHPNLHGILWMLLSCVSTAVVVGIVRHLSADLHVSQLVFFRTFVALLLFLPWLWRKGVGAVKTARLRLYFIRSLTAMAGMYTWFYALTVVPLPLATALSFTAPLFTALFAAIFLGDRFGARRWAALVVGFFGTLVILRPGTEQFDAHALLVIISTLFWASAGIIIKNLTRTDAPAVVAFYMTLMVAPITFLAALPWWQPVDPALWPWLLALGLGSNVTQISAAHAIARAEFAVILPFDFTRLIFVSAIAYAFFGEALDLWTALGAGIIMASAVYTAWREARRTRRRALPGGM